jgi:N6-L-threonylcarbamoyladenine synthase
MADDGKPASLIVLGIETSCDETAAAIVRRNEDGSGEILASVVRSQLDLHAAYGGVVPEIAARAHVELLDAAIKQALAESGLSFAAIDAVAAAIWAGYVTGLGYLGGETFRDDRWKALAASLTLAGVIAVAAEVVRRAVAERVGRLTLRPAPRSSIMQGGGVRRRRRATTKDRSPIHRAALALAARAECRPDRGGWPGWSCRLS